MAKERLDVLIVSRGLSASREKAKALIMEGRVYVNGQKEDKPGSVFPDECEIEIKGEKLKYVSRGGLKLEKAIDVFGVMLTDLICLDIGASTGGFTDCMLQNKAGKVYSVDVGYGQLDYSLRNDDRVICMERTNFRYVTRDDIPEEIDFASCDVAFISLDKILQPAYDLLKDGGYMVSLIKPQFEAGKNKVGKNGVVSDPKVHREVIEKILNVSKDTGFIVCGLDFSPVKGPKGNIEYLIYMRKGEGDVPEINPDAVYIKELVEKAHKEAK